MSKTTRPRAHWQPLSWYGWTPHPFWVWCCMKRMAEKGRGQSQSLITPLRPKPPEKGCHLAVTPTEQDHVARSRRETLIMLSLSAVMGRHAGIESTWPRLSPAARIFCPAVFQKKTGGRKGRSRYLKRKLSASAERQDWTLAVRTVSPAGCSVSVGLPQAWHTLSVNVISVQGSPSRLTICNNAFVKTKCPLFWRSFRLLADGGRG